MTVDKTIMHVTSRVGKKIHTYAYIFIYMNEDSIAKLIMPEVNYLLWDL